MHSRWQVQPQWMQTKVFSLLVISFSQRQRPSEARFFTQSISELLGWLFLNSCLLEDLMLLVWVFGFSFGRLEPKTITSHSIAFLLSSFCDFALLTFIKTCMFFFSFALSYLLFNRSQKSPSKTFRMSSGTPFLTSQHFLKNSCVISQTGTFLLILLMQKTLMASQRPVYTSSTGAGKRLSLSCLKYCSSSLPQMRFWKMLWCNFSVYSICLLFCIVRD